ncbi:MAG: AAA family ATPase [Synergistaceae bacterium]|nr:AAA family ATPase [Synergistaceae bacterium]
MLESLRLWNIGGIRNAELRFGPGLTVITGESGTGKSSVVRALELAAGKRSEGQFLRAGEDEGGAEARFLTEEPFPGLDDPLQPEGGVALARRVLTRGESGGGLGSSPGVRSHASLQGVRVPLATYSLALGRLVHIQSQFAQMELLDGDKQLAMIDSCTPAEFRDVALELRRTFEQAQERDKKLKAMTRRRAEIEQRYANANEVLALVRRVSPEPGMEAQLEGEISTLARRISQRERAQENLNRLSGGLSEQGLLSETRNALDSLVGLLSDAEERRQSQRAATEALHVLEDIVEAARGMVEGGTEELQERERLEARLGALRRLKRLSGAEDEAELLAYCQDAAENLEWLERSYPQLEEASKESLELKRRANALAMELRRGRKDAAERLSERVNALLGDLAMGGTVFEAHFQELPKLRRTGADEVEFALRAGKRLGRVDKVASGGELSRLLLALQLSLPDKWLPPTLVFDEVEAGLGGRAAVLSGMKLKELSRRCQVLLVTHEASIAALGDAHILIQRIEGESRIRPIDGVERVREIARMLSGSPDLKEAQEHARTLLNY